MMNVLISVGSRHGSTREIAEAIARTLRNHTDISVNVQDAGMVPSLAGYDAVVIGSAIYMSRFVEPTRDFVDRYEQELAALPTWVFASGPTGDPLRPEGMQPPVQELAARLGSRGQRIFAGKVPDEGLGFGESMIVNVVRAQVGDYRDWDAIEAYANELASEILALAPTGIA